VFNIDKEIQSIDEEIQEFQDRKRILEVQKQSLAELPDKCPSCGGSGTERYTDAAGDVDERDCLTCRGLGRIGPIKCPCGHTIDVDMVHARRQPLPSCPWCGKLLGGQYRYV
jgi:rubrerythrin